jgi:hypothetical protein
MPILLLPKLLLLHGVHIVLGILAYLLCWPQRLLASLLLLVWFPFLLLVSLLLGASLLWLASLLILVSLMATFLIDFGGIPAVEDIPILLQDPNRCCRPYCSWCPFM